MTQQIKNIVAFAFALVFTASSYATEYLSFEVGTQTHKSVISQLTQARAHFNSDYGYRGYSDLPMIKVNSYDSFDKHGRVKEAWLYFTNQNILYKVEVTWRDAGSLKNKFKDALDSKYGYANQKGSGFNTNYHYRDKQVSIVMARNEFGFGDNQTTSLTYTFEPALAEVQKTKNLVDEHIKKQNAASVSNDL